MKKLKQSKDFIIYTDNRNFKYSLMNGLFNEVMSCAIQRSNEFQHMDETVSHMFD